MHESRLYLVGRADLGPGLRAAQAGHAAFAFALEHHAITSAWHPNFLILVEVPDLRALLRLSVTARMLRIPQSTWHEPDLNDQLTAVALAPCSRSKFLCSNLPLMHSTCRSGESNLPAAPCLGSSTTEQRSLTPTVEGLTPSPGAPTVPIRSLEVM